MNGADAVVKQARNCLRASRREPDPPVYAAFARRTTVRHVLPGTSSAHRVCAVGAGPSPPGPRANLVTPIADAWMDSTPLRPPPARSSSHLIGTDAFQECDIVGVTTRIVKHSWLVQGVEEIPHVLKAAFHVHRPLLRAGAR